LAAIDVDTQTVSSKRLVEAVDEIAVRVSGPGEWAVLGLLSERPAHGWAIAKVLDPAGELGAVWSLGRPLVYRSIELLRRSRLIEPVGHEPGVRGPNRTLYGATEAGAEAFTAWLREPVDHVRDARSSLLLKIVLADRAGVDLTPMLRAQHSSILTALRMIEPEVDASTGTRRTLLRFRLESMRGVLHFLEGFLADRAPAPEPAVEL
jgi:DNA-binding PadR family transcriptional regulator